MTFPHPRQHTRHLPNRQRGFALIIALSLMSFIVLLLLSLSTLTSVQTTASSSEIVQLQARQNALLGLNIALAELQRTAGADQRVSGSAAMGEADDFGGGTTTHRTTLNGLRTTKPGTRHWTGIWGNADLPERIYTKSPTPILLNWLVSGNENIEFTALGTGNISAAAIQSATSAYLPDDNTVPTSFNQNDLGDWALLVGAGSARNSDDYVVAPAVTIDPSGENRYAWWVGDQGIKADYGAFDRHADGGTPPDTSTQEGRYRMSLAQRNAIELLNGLDSAPISPSPEQQTRIDSLLRREQIPLSAPSIAQDTLKQHFHNLSLHSLGVLSNSQNGGLRKDLTSHLYAGTLSDRIIPNLAQPSDATEQAMVKEINLLPNPRWEHLKSFHDQVAAAAGGTPIEPVVGNENIHHITPVITQLRTLIRLRVAPAADDDADRELFLGFSPVIVLGNPYNTPLKSDGVDFRYHPRGGRSEDLMDEETKIELTLESLGGTPLNITASGGAVRYLKRHDETQAIRSLLGGIVMRTGPFTIEPGEQAVFSLQSNYVATSAAIQVVQMAEGTTGIDPDRAIEIPIGFAPADALNANGSAATRWQMSVLMPTGNNWGRFSFSMYPGGSGTVNAPIGARPLQRIEQVNLDGNPTTSLNFPAPERGTLVNAGGSAQDRFDNSAFIPYFARLHHLVMPEEQQGRQRIYTSYNLRAQVWRRPLPDDRENSLGSNPLISIQFPVTMGSSSGTFFTSNLPPRWGNRVSTGGSEKLVLFDMVHANNAQSPLLSLGSLAHANLTFSHHAALPQNGQSMAITRNMSIGEQGGYTIGASWANPYLRRGLSLAGMSRPKPDGSGNIWETSFDMSYLLNNALFDDYFFSTVPQGASSTLPASLPNARLNPLTDNLAKLQDPNTAAANMVIRGAFNVNSVSVEAWKAILGSVRGGSDNTPYYRSLYQPEGDTGNTGVKSDIYAGFRKLSDTQIDALAEAIVSQVRQRGPFISLAHFVNRRLDIADNTSPLGLKGALQSALDTATVAGAPLNNPLEFANVTATTSNDVAAYRDLPAATGPQAAGAPGWLSQPDLLQVLAPILSARSDTFIIRAYGEVKDPNTGVVKARQWCEALVQRTPEPVTPDTNDENEPAAKNDLGRRFQIIDFRWLDPDSV